MSVETKRTFFGMKMSEIENSMKMYDKTIQLLESKIKEWKTYFDDYPERSLEEMIKTEKRSKKTLEEEYDYIKKQFKTDKALSTY